MQLTVKDAAKTLHVTEKTIYRWIQSGGLPVYRVAGQYRINRAMLFDWASSKRVNFAATREEPEPELPLPHLLDALKTGGVYYRIAGKTAPEVFRNLVRQLDLPDQVDRDFLCQSLLQRESLQSTGVGDGIALPHVRNPAILEIKTPGIALCFLENPIEFHALDGQPVDILFILLAPTVRIHLHLLSRLSFVLRDTAFKKLLHDNPGRDELYAAVSRLETAIGE
jgi:PTS system nitrogen regulatory IIA component